ncbi:MAG: hypothetical protein ACK46Y_11280 [Fluviicola sp.]
MNKNIQSSLKILFFFILIICFSNSCTIQKRLFSPGYSIEWKGKKTQPNKTIHSVYYKDESTESSILKEVNPEIELVKIDSLAKDEIIVNSKFIKPQTNNKTHRTFTSVLTKSSTTKHIKNEVNREDEPFKNKPFAPESGLASLIFSVISIIGWFLFVSNATFFTFAVVIGFGLLGIILGAVAIKDHKRNPDKYLRKWPSYLGFWLSFTSTLLFIGVFVLVFIALTNWGG